MFSWHLKALVFLYAFEESVDCHLLSSFCDDSNLHISLFKYVLSTMSVSKESISKFLIGNRFHVKLRILSPENCKQSLRVKSWKAEVTAEKKQPKLTNQNFYAKQQTKTFKLNQSLTCADFGIYVATCVICHEQYVGHTSNKFSKRWSAHRSNWNKQDCKTDSDKDQMAL